MMKRYLLILSFILSLTACSGLPAINALPEQKTESMTFKVEQWQNGSLYQTSLLSVQFQPKQWRFVQTEPLGSPIARLLLNEQGFQNDGFVMPNQQAQWLFFALSAELSRPLSLKEIETKQQGSKKIYRQNGKFLWKTQVNHQAFTITLADGSEWHIETLQ